MNGFHHFPDDTDNLTTIGQKPRQREDRARLLPFAPGDSHLQKAKQRLPPELNTRSGWKAPAPALLSAGNLALDCASSCHRIQDLPGNYLDVVSCPAGELAFIIGDTERADPLPALCARHFLRGAISLGQTEPKVFARGLNAMIYDCCATRGYLRCFYAHYTRGSSTLRYVNAGHEPPLLIRDHTDGVLRLEKGGPVLGLQARPTYAEGTLQLRTGDRLVAYTYGVIESLARQSAGSAEAALIDLMKNGRNRSAAELVNLVIARTEAADRGTSLDRGVIAARVDAMSSARDAPNMREKAAVLAEA